MIKRLLDFSLALISFIFLSGLAIICVIVASIDTKSFGIFVQIRIGQYGNPFKIFKIKSFSDTEKEVTAFGRFLRASKLDEIPQLVNVILGAMSFVGPRPDIAGYADSLEGDDRIILSIKPGITGLASLKYRNEEELLLQQKLPLEYNDKVIWPDKVRINKWYVENRTMCMDLRILFYTIIPINFHVDNFMRDWR